MAVLRIAGIVNESIVDGPGLRFVVFTQGCPHHCPECQNPHTHDPAGGYDIDTDTLAADILRNGLVQGVTLSGGEPFAQAAALLPLARTLRAAGRHLMAYSGYTLEELLASEDEAVHALLSTLDLLVDGRFLLEQRSLELRFRGSANQRVLDVQASLAAGSAIWDERYR